MSKEEKPVAGLEPEDNEPDLNEMIGSLLRTARRGKWHILVTFALLTVAVAGFSLQLPDIYVSESMVGIVQRQVSERVAVADAIPITGAVTALRQEILSRPFLTRIIEELHLYADQPDATAEDLALQMQSDLMVEAVEARRDEISALKISFTAQDPQVAQRVTGRLTAAFIEENVKQRDVRVETGTTFLDEEVREAKRKLDQQSYRLQAYQTKNLEQLPDQQATNAIALGDLRARKRGIAPDLDRLLRNLRALETTVGDKIQQLQTDRTQLMRTLTAQHREVVKKDAEIALYGAVRELFRPEGPSDRARQILVASEDSRVKQIQAQASDFTDDIEKLKADDAEIERQISDLSSKVRAAPLRAQEQSGVQAELKLLQEAYDSLRKRQLDSGVSSNLAVVDDGGRFRLIEPPTFPSRPSGPNRLRFAVAGAAGGLLLGILLAILSASMNTTFLSEKEVSKAFSVPLVLGIPQILTPREQSLRTWKSVLEWAGVAALVAVAISTEVYIFLKG